MISKELLSEICQTNLVSLGKLEVIGSDICLYDCSMQPDIYMCWNIYELAHKCKEWAYTNKYRLSSSQHRLNTKQEYYINNQIASYFCSVYYITNDDSDIQMDANTEPEAIFKACQWILDKDSK